MNVVSYADRYTWFDAVVSRFGASETRVAWVLLDALDAKVDNAQPSHEEIAAYLGITERSVGRAIRVLVDAEMLIVTARLGRKGNCRYKLTSNFKLITSE